MKRGLGLKELGAVVDLDKIQVFAQGLHKLRQRLDQTTGGIQIIAHYEVDQCVESSCWYVSKQTNWKNKNSWFVPLNPQGTGFSHPLFDKYKPSGVFLWAPSVLAEMNSAKGNTASDSMAQQALKGMPAQCKAILDAEKEEAWEPDPEIFKDPKGWLKK